MNSIVGRVAQQQRFIVKNIPLGSVQMILGHTIIISLVAFLPKPKWEVALVLNSGVIVFQSWSIWNQVQLYEKEVIVLAHRSRNTVLLHLVVGDSRSIISSDSSNIGNIAANFSVAERI